MSLNALGWLKIFFRELSMFYKSAFRESRLSEQEWLLGKVHPSIQLFFSPIFLFHSFKFVLMVLIILWQIRLGFIKLISNILILVCLNPDDKVLNLSSTNLIHQINMGVQGEHGYQHNKKYLKSETLIFGE